LSAGDFRCDNTPVSKMNPADRALILRRRALFVGSTLAALGSCAREAPPAEHGKSETVMIPEADRDAAGAAEGQDGAAVPPRVRPSGDLPPFDTPPGVSGVARDNYEHLARTMQAAHRTLDELESAIPTCPISDPSCENRWRAVAERQYELENVFRFYHICPGRSEEARAFNERDKAHRAYFEARRSKLQARLEAALGAGGAQRFEQMLMDVRQARPVPCLSFACSDW
jgi:hypothetical protein